MAVHLRSLSFSAGFHDVETDRFPFSVPSIRSIDDHPLEFTTPVTFFVGENGSGKSTLLEAIAYITDLPSASSIDTERDPTLNHIHELGNCLRLEWSRGRTHRGMYLRAEDFFGFAKRMDTIRDELERELERIDNDETLTPRSRQMARMAYASELAALQERYGQGVDTRSHGEQFINLFGHRLVPNGVHLIDEPEAPLSPTRQLSFMSLIRTLSREDNAQFIIATHSPILLALPEASIFEFTENVIRPVVYDDLEHVSLTRDFLNDPASFLRYL